MAKEIKVPDIGEFEGVEVIEVHIEKGQTVAPEDPLITLESDKASMEVPAPEAGTIAEVKVRAGDKVSEGDVIAMFEAAKEAATAEPPTQEKEKPSEREASPSPAPAPSGSDKSCDLLVLGAGPGGYTAAFRAADLGLKVILVERWPVLGGVCLNVGCIPSKALLHVARVIAENREMAEHGLAFKGPEIDLDKLRSWKDSVVNKLVTGLSGLAKQRKVEVVTGKGRFTSPNQVTVEAEDGKTTTIGFGQAIIAAGSEPARLPFLPYDDKRILDSTSALEIDGIPKRMLVIGGGIIGLEMACIYSELGARITVCELLNQLMPGADKDLVTPLQKRISKLYDNIYLDTKVTKVEPQKNGLKVTFEGKDAPETDTFDRILVAVGRTPNGKVIEAAKAGVEVDEAGFIAADSQLRTNVPHIFAIGDIIGQPMLAHKATHEGKTAAEVAAGKKTHFDAKTIPSVAYTDPEVAWAGLTENEAKAQNIKYGKGTFPWAASGRALSLARDEGVTKILFDEETHRIIGCGIVGPSAGDLIAEAAHAIEMGSDASDIGLTIHPHPTLSETFAFAAEMFDGTITDLMPPKKR